MQIAKTDNFSKQYQKLSLKIQKKTDKQLNYLMKDIRHPSLRSKKIAGFEDVWEGRVDRFYRFAFHIEGDIIILLRVGPHEEGLGKK